ncbi:MAG: hypothetical protein JOZ77_00690 [Candidatus Eremiobacteraeota bacterium]|nr:hypothetical protein [Candidatus Eremiobacteraeota bacterium]
MWSQPAIFNVLDPWYEASPGVFVPMIPNSKMDAPTNTLVLQEIINLAQASDDQSGPYYGAIIVFPGHSQPTEQGGTGEDSGGEYYLQAAGDGSALISIDSNWPIRFLGTGSAKLVYYIPPGDQTFEPGDMFALNTAAGDNTGGMTFEDLTFAYPPINESAGIPNYAAIHTVPNSGMTGGGAQNVRIIRCVLPIALSVFGLNKPSSAVCFTAPSTMRVTQARA